MISKKEYVLLNKIILQQPIKFEDFKSEIFNLSNEGLLGYYYHDKYEITPLGFRAYEEYKQNNSKKKKENFSLMLSILAIVVSIVALVLKAF